MLFMQISRLQKNCNKQFEPQIESGAVLGKIVFALLFSYKFSCAFQVKEVHTTLDDINRNMEIFGRKNSRDELHSFRIFFWVACFKLCNFFLSTIWGF